VFCVDARTLTPKYSIGYQTCILKDKGYSFSKGNSFY